MPSMLSYPRRLQSGHFTCYLIRTYHVLTTDVLFDVDKDAPTPVRRPAMTATAPQISIRDLRTIDELNQLKAVEKEVWGMADDDTLPLTLAIALKAAGNIFVGAFDKEKLVGFAFGFLGREHGQTIIHSHMLAVFDAYRHL